jgi:hypothetical protein
LGRKLRFRDSNILLAVSSTVSTATLLLATVAIAVSEWKPVSPNPDLNWNWGTPGWPDNTIWGTDLTIDNQPYDAWFGVKASPEYGWSHETPPETFWLDFVDGPYHGIVKTQNFQQTYAWYMEIFNGYPYRDNLTVGAGFENATHEFVPYDFSVIFENRDNNLSINLRVENGLIHLPHGITYATLYIVNFVPKVSVSISPSYKERPRSSTIYYTVTLTSLADNPENLDLLAPSSFSYYLNATDNLGWSIELSENFFENVLPGENRTITLTVIIPDNAAIGTQDNITVTANSRTDPWVGNNAVCRAVVRDNYQEDVHLVAGWNLVNFRVQILTYTYPEDYIIYKWNAPGGPFSGVDPYVSHAPHKLENIGYWIWIRWEYTVSRDYASPIPRNIYLVLGWNLVGFPIADNTTTPNKIFEPLNYVTDYIIYRWETPGGPYHLQGANELINDNIGYWVLMGTSKTVTLY